MIARRLFACGAAVALYTAAAFGILVVLGLPYPVACLVSAVLGVGIAAVAARYALPVLEAAPVPEPETAEPEPLPAPEPIVERGFAVAESREERECREIQAALLPSSAPAIDGYHFEVAYEPCGVLGGDLYDFLELADGRILVTLGDVSGKGPAGAIVMAMVQTLVRREAPHALGPADLLHRVNNGFAGTLGKGVFVTALFGILDPFAHRFTLAGAGHHPALLLNPQERRTTHVPGRGVALGIVSGEAFRDKLCETAIDLAPGDSLLLFTDGATDCDEELSKGVGESRLLAAAAAAVLPGPRDALKRLRDDLWQSGGRRDDTTLVLLSRLLASARRSMPPGRTTDDAKV
ncbi:MAG: PP2C family protein-serine/threonine phosphatase [Planctomycetota bacterium]|jgi:sigma-B regulation protein RsbU (phosphoserine phosphatase)